MYFLRLNGIKIQSLCSMKIFTSFNPWLRMCDPQLDKAGYENLEGTRELLVMDFLKECALKPNLEEAMFKRKGKKHSYLLREFTMIKDVPLVPLWNLDELIRVSWVLPKSQEESS